MATENVWCCTWVVLVEEAQSRNVTLDFEIWNLGRCKIARERGSKGAREGSRDVGILGRDSWVEGQIW